MSFLAPAAFVFAAALPAVVFFYLLKRRRTTTLVSSTLLWERFLAEARFSAPFRKLRFHALLFFQLLAVSLAVLALARPYLPSGAMLQGRLHVVILDGSASMQATDVSPSRFEAARKKVLELIRAMRDRDRTALILAAGHTEVKQSPTSNKARLRAAAAECRPADAAGDLTEALRLAKSLVRDRPDARIHLFSDGVTEAVNEKGDMFEEERLAAVLLSAEGSGAEETLKRVLEAVDRFRGRCELTDDLSVVVVHRTNEG